ncbi:MAG: ribosome-associated translation inhibitor RaiA [Oscillospiraceae bacterium]|nr:ribosome-associated translation inhibitor RaiA [Oscillospiraceae bacterium]
MTIKISSKDIKITPDIEQSVEKKLTQRLRKYSSRQESGKPVNVRVSERKPSTRVDVDMPYLNFYIHAEAVTTDGILGGIDKCMDIIDRQVAKYKSRMNKMRTKSGGLKKEILDIVPDDVLLTPDTSDVSEDEPAYKIVKAEAKPQPMSIEEAVLQMEVLEFKFFVFYDIDKDAVSIIYRRDDGNIGLIET